MVSAISRLLSKEWHNVHQAALVLAGAALASQFLALLRDRLLAGTFGASRTLDVYYAAFRIPDLVYVTLASFVSVTVLIPVVTRLASKREEVDAFLSQVGTVFISVMAGVAFLLVVLMPGLAHIIAPGFSPAELELLVTLSRLMLLSPILLGLSNILGSVTQVYQRFFLYALAPVLYNLGIIFGLVALYPFLGAVGLALGVVLGAAAHALIQLPALREQGITLTLTYPEGLALKRMRDVVKVSIPRTLTLASHQLAFAGLIAFGSLLGVGSITLFTLAWNLQSVPVALFGVSYSVAAFPTLSRFAARGEKERFMQQIYDATRHLIFWSLPAAALIIVLRAHLVRVIYGAGAFDWTATRITAAALALFALSLVAQNILLVFVRGYYATGETRVPMLVNSLSSLSIVVLAPLFIFLFQRVPAFTLLIERIFRIEALPGTELLMLPLAFSVGLLVNLILLWWRFEREHGPLFMPLIHTIYQSLLSSVLMGAVAYYALSAFEGFVNTQTLWGIFFQGFFSGVLGILSGILLLIIFDSVELFEVRDSLHRKFIRRRLVLPDPEEL